MYYNMYNNNIEIAFGWDDYKELDNIRKHGISFKKALYVFTDINIIEYYDYIHNNYEQRYITVGMVNEIICVAYTVRNERNRIISARAADSNEKENYIKWVGLH